VPLVLPAPSG